MLTTIFSSFIRSSGQGLALFAIAILLFLGFTPSALALNHTVSILAESCCPAVEMNCMTLQPQWLMAEARRPSKTEIVAQELHVVASDRTSPVEFSVTLPPEVAAISSLFRAPVPGTTAIANGYALEIETSYIGEPDGFYEVYVNLPDEEAKSDLDTYFAGTIVFFVNASPRRVRKTFRLDITDELLAQLETFRSAATSNAIALSIFKVGGSADEEIRIEKVSLYAY